MATNVSNLTLDLVSQPFLHKLTLLLWNDGVDIVVTSRIYENDIICRHIAFEAGHEVIRQLEEIVYANPLLTADFFAVEVILDNNRYFVMSTPEATQENISERLDILWPFERTGVRLTPVTNTVEQYRTTMVTGVPRDLLSFLRRTWNNPSIAHRLAILARYYALKNKLGNRGKLHVKAHDDKVDIVAMGRDGLLAVNTFRTPGGVDDAVYFITAMARHLDFDNDSDQIILAGNNGMRDGLLVELRKYFVNVMPEIQPPFVASAMAVCKDIPTETLLINKI